MPADTPGMFKQIKSTPIIAVNYFGSTRKYVYGGFLDGLYVGPGNGRDTFSFAGESVFIAHQSAFRRNSNTASLRFANFASDGIHGMLLVGHGLEL